MSQHKTSIPEEVVQQAIHWKVRLESGRAQEEDYRACQQWRDLNPTHDQAWLRLTALDTTFNQLAQHAPTVARDTLQASRAELTVMNRRQALRRLGTTACSISALCWLSHEQGLLTRFGADYASFGVMEQRVLADNSHLWLNRHSAVSVNFNIDYRELALSLGEVQVATAADKRPFVISLPQGRLVTSDARFTLRHGKETSLLQLDTGSLLLEPAATGAAAHIEAGQVLEIGHQHTRAIDRNTFDYSSWVQGVLSVRNMSLQHFLNELSRYRTGTLKCDPTLAQHLLSGVYQLQDTHKILQILARSANAQLRFFTPWRVEIIPR